MEESFLAYIQDFRAGLVKVSACLILSFTMHVINWFKLIVLVGVLFLPYIKSSGSWSKKLKEFYIITNYNILLEEYYKIRFGEGWTFIFKEDNRYFIIYPQERLELNLDL